MRARPALIAAGMVAMLAVAGLGAGFAAFIAVSRRTEAAPPLADGIVALTGGADRVATALHLLVAGQAHVLLVSGVAPGAGLGELARRSDVNPAALQGRVTLGREAASTRGNATETAAWAQANAIRTLIVVTAGYHMPRALLELRRAMPAMHLVPLPVQPTADGRVRWRLLAVEYAKLIGAWLGLSRIARQPAAEGGATLWTTL